MDGKGSWRDNVFIERLWRSVKYEEVYLRAYDSVGHARASATSLCRHVSRRSDTSSPIQCSVIALGVGREGDVLGCTVASTVTRARFPGVQRSAVVCHAQTLGQQQLELVAQALAPVAKIGALVREAVLEEHLAGEVLEVRIFDD
jgi:hypothetical protein